MIIWCAYCQNFLRESAPFEDLTVSHGMCPDCAQKGLSQTKVDETKLDQLVQLQKELYSAGHSGDFSRIEPLIKISKEMGIRPIDMIFGFLNPMLIRIGELWNEGTITYKDEHRFTGFCVKLLEALKSQSKMKRNNPQFLLVSADGNNHNFGLQLLQLWLEAQDCSVELVTSDLKMDQLLDYTLKIDPLYVGVSISLPEQALSVQSFIKTLNSKKTSVQQIFIGGYAVKAGLLTAQEMAPAIMIKDAKDLLPYLPQNHLNIG